MRFHHAAVAAVVAAVLSVLALSASGANAAPYHEITGPADAPGAVLVMHGGGWEGDNPALVTAMRPHAKRYDSKYLVYNVDYRTTRRGYEDVLAFYDEIRAAKGPDFPICVWGLSAGGHYALMLAGDRDVACTISYAGPTNLMTASPYLMPYASAAFGYTLDALRHWSPALHTDRLTAPVLLSYAENDPLVTPSQAYDYAQRTSRATLVMLPAGDRGLYHVHSPVDATALRAYWTQEQAFVDASMAQWNSAHQPPASAPAPAPAPPAPAPAPVGTPQDAADNRPTAQRKRTAKRQRKTTCAKAHARSHRSSRRAAHAKARKSRRGSHVKSRKATCAKKKKAHGKARRAHGHNGERSTRSRRS